MIGAEISVVIPTLGRDMLRGCLDALAAGTATWAALPAELPWLVLVVLGGAITGTWLGLQKLSTRWLLALMALVLTIAAAKLILTA